jgi:hypothetical protein
MLTLPEIVRSVYGIWRLARFDAIGMEWLDRTDEGFWRSFRVAILLLPIEIAMSALLVAHLENPEPLPYIAVVIGIGYVISWTAFPVAARPLIAALGRTERYPPYITALNWSRILIYAVVVPLSLLGFSTSSPLVHVLFLAFYVAWGAYHFFITRTALDLDAVPSLGLTMMEMLLIIATDHVTLLMMSAEAPAAA